MEIRDDLRARLLELAARRGHRGFSEIVGEAIEAYLRAAAANEAARREALKLRGTVSPEEADRLHAHASATRSSWR